MPVLLAIASSVLYGAADFLGGLGARRAPVATVTLLSQAVGLLVLLASAPFVPGATRGADLAWGAAAGLAGGCGVLLLYRALAAGTVSTAAPLISMLALTVPVVAGLVAGERPGALPLMGIVAGALAVLLMSGGSGAREAAATGPISTVYLGRMSSLGAAVAAGLLIGAFLVFLGRIAPGASLWPLVSARAAGALAISAVAIAGGATLRPPARAVGPIAGAGTADVVANLFYVVAVQRGPLSLIATLVSLAPATTVALAQIVLRERLTALQRRGVALALVAVVLLSRGPAR